jgi:hypothetical protein
VTEADEYLKLVDAVRLYIIGIEDYLKACIAAANQFEEIITDMNLHNAKCRCLLMSTETIRYVISHSREGYCLTRIVKASPKGRETREILIGQTKCRARFLAMFWEKMDSKR